MGSKLDEMAWVQPDQGVDDHDRLISLIVAKMELPPRAVNLDLGAQEMVDMTSKDFARGLVKELHGNGIEVYAADVHAPVFEIGSKPGLIGSIGPVRVFPSVDAAVCFIETSA